MAALTLVIGYKQTSSWSLRAWLAMRKTGAPFDEETARYRTEAGRRRLAKLSPTGKVPFLLHQAGDTTVKVWESIAICDYLAELFPDRHLWPTDPAARALARSVAAEMHAGFVPLRQHMPMDLFARHPAAGHDRLGVAEDIARVAHIWRQCRSDYGAPAGGPCLFGDFTIADAMFAPVAARFRSYGVALDTVCRDYMETIFADPDFRAWEAAAERQGRLDQEA